MERQQRASPADDRTAVRPARAAAAAVAAISYGWWAVSLPPFSASATVAVVAGGLAASAAGLLLGRREGAGCGLREIAPWLVLAGFAGLWQLAAYLQSPREAHPTVSSLTNALLDSHPARVAAFAVWLLGAAMLARR